MQSCENDMLVSDSLCHALRTERNFFDTVLPLTAVSYMLSGVIPVPGGFGSVEGIFYLLFSPLTGQGAVLSAILIFRFAVTFFPALIGAFVFFTE